MRYVGPPWKVYRFHSVDVQPLIDKITSNLPVGQGTYVTMAGRNTLVKAIITSEAIHHLTLLVLSRGSMGYMKKLQRVFIWGGLDKISRGKCKVIRWDFVYRPINKGGLSIFGLG
jgi:hypothetical protein